jgi:hypothetical protein
MIILSNESQYERYRIFTLLRNAVSIALGRRSASSAAARIRELEADMEYFRALTLVRNAVSTIVAQRANNRRLEPKQIAFDNANSSIQQLEASSNHARTGNGKLNASTQLA